MTQIDNSTRLFNVVTTETQSTEQSLPRNLQFSIKEIVSQIETEKVVGSGEGAEDFETSFAAGLRVGCSQGSLEQGEKENVSPGLHRGAFKKKSSKGQVYTSRAIFPVDSQKNPEKDLSFLQPLKHKLPNPTLLQSLNNSKFAFDPSFYTQCLQLLENLGYEDSPDHSYLEAQHSLCLQIRKLTQEYSSPVNEDEEERIRGNLELCKRMYAGVDVRKVGGLVRKYVRMGGESLGFRVGRMGVQVGVQKELLGRIVEERYFREMASTLFVIHCHHGIAYARDLLAQVELYLEHLLQQFQNQPANEQLKQKLLLGSLVIWIGLLYCQKPQLPITQSLLRRLLRRLPQIKTLTTKRNILPSYYLTFLAQQTDKASQNAYTLLAVTRQFMEQHPVCCLCWRAVEIGHGDGVREDGGDWHVGCWGFWGEVRVFCGKK